MVVLPESEGHPVGMSDVEELRRAGLPIDDINFSELERVAGMSADEHANGTIGTAN